MADRNLAKMIWEIAKNDKTLDGLELQEMYKKKIRIDADDQKEKLKKIVADYIKGNYQPVKTSIVLENNGIIGGMATYTQHQLRPNSGPPMTEERRTELNNSIYAYKHQFGYMEVTNRESQNLIKYAILPLGLKWKLQSWNGYNSQIVISWDHWPEV
jgi:hypothetical protein